MKRAAGALSTVLVFVLVGCGGSTGGGSGGSSPTLSQVRKALESECFRKPLKSEYYAVRDLDLNTLATGTLLSCNFGATRGLALVEAKDDKAAIGVVKTLADAPPENGGFKYVYLRSGREFVLPGPMADDAKVWPAIAKACGCGKKMAGGSGPSDFG